MNKTNYIIIGISIILLSIGIIAKVNLFTILSLIITISIVAYLIKNEKSK
ncbi:hypothetical protein C8N26_0583 [Tenacibaculum lutimaris]|uniref:Uncharacterized protein n=1 Tax=Tenacibaculum lutimaris TaxID=285258 RepID=A0A420E550_9FLAO|nr:hypothetical protein C8N26_0583 [Tenacibaculum lutimaris]